MVLLAIGSVLDTEGRLANQSGSVCARMSGQIDRK